MATIYWSAGASGSASVGGNWVGGAPPGGGDVAYFNSGNSNHNCDWDIASTFGSIYVNSDYTGTIDLSEAMTMTHASQGPVFGNTLSTINTHDKAVTWTYLPGAYYFTPGGTINWGDTDLTVNGAINAGGVGTMNIGAGTWLSGDDFRLSDLDINITGNGTFGASGNLKPIGGGNWTITASPTIWMARPYGPGPNIIDPGTSTFIWKLNSNDSDDWRMQTTSGTRGFYNFIADFNDAPSIRIAEFFGPTGTALDYPPQFQNLTISGGTVTMNQYTKLMLHCDGEDWNGSSTTIGVTFIDDSGRNHTVTRGGDTHTDTTIKKFGTASAQFDGDDYLSLADNGDWTFGTGDFTIDLWVYPTDIGGGGNEIFINAATNQYINFGMDNSGKLLFYIGNGTWQSIPAGAGTALTNDSWQHVAVTRSGGTVKLFVDGAVVADRTQAESIDPPDIEIGSAVGGTSDTFTGYMDEIRISKGVARWTSAFTPETAAYPDQPGMIINGFLSVNDDNDGDRAGLFDGISGSLHVGDVNADTGGTFDAPEGLTVIKPLGSNVWRSTGGDLNHNNGLVKISNIDAIATNCQVDGNGSNNFYDLEIAMDTGNKVEFTGTPTIIDNNLYVTSGRFQGSAASPYLQVAENTRVSHASGTFAPSGGPVRGTPTRAAILGGESQSSDNTFKDLTIYNSGTMEATTGETIFDGGGIGWQDLDNDAAADEPTRFIHNGGTIVASGGACSFRMGTWEDNDYPGIAGGSSMPAISDTYGCNNFICKTTTSYSLGGGSYQGINGNWTIDTPGVGWFDRQTRVGGNLYLNQGELRIDGNTKNLIVNGNIIMLSGTKLGGKRTDGSHPWWGGWLLVDGAFTLGKDGAFYTPTGSSATDKFNFSGTKVGSWHNNGSEVIL